MKDAPEGTKLYSLIFGECELKDVRDNKIIVESDAKGYYSFYENGNIYKDCDESLLFPSKDNRDWSTFKVEKDVFKIGDHVKNKETGDVYILTQKKISETEGFWAKRMTYSSEDCEVFISKRLYDEYERIDKFHPSFLKPFDRVLIRDGSKATWFASSISHLRDEYYPYVITNGCGYGCCVPYNDETKDLLGTDNEEPDFYKKDL